MKIAIDVRRIADFGIGTYIRNTLRALGRLDSENSYFLIGSPDRTREIGPLPVNFRTIPFPAKQTAFNQWFRFRTIVSRLECDVVHIPHLFAFPRSLPGPYIITVHDVLEHLSHARGLSEARRMMHFHLTRRALHGASRLVAVSDFTRQELQNLFQIPGSRTEVIYNAIDERFLRGHATDAERRLIAERYQVTNPFLLYAGRVSPHKNIVRIIDAFSVLKSELAKEGQFPDLKLIIIGDDVSSHPDLRRAVVRGRVHNDVRFLGFVPIEILRIFYDAAKIFVFPSLYEGFGLPPLEAMAHGTPVVTSNTSSLPEVVGNAAIMVNPENVFEITRALLRVLLDQPLREKLKQQSLDQAARFSWEDSGRKLLTVYGDVAGRNPRVHASANAIASSL